VAVVIGAHVNEIENAFARFANAEITIGTLNRALIHTVVSKRLGGSASNRRQHERAKYAEPSGS
jgi:hypothetical protein